MHVVNPCAIAHHTSSSLLNCKVQSGKFSDQELQALGTGTDTHGLPQPALKRALDYIHSHLSHKVGIQELADHLSLSPYYFCRMFKKSVGVSPHQYLTQQRIERAKQLLRWHDFPIVEIAYECGFSSQSHLTRYFKQQTGLTPKRFREGHVSAPCSSHMSDAPDSCLHDD